MTHTLHAGDDGWKPAATMRMEMQAHPKRLAPHVDEDMLHMRHEFDFTGPSPAEYAPRGVLGEAEVTRPGTAIRFKGAFFGSQPRFRLGEFAGIDSPGPAYLPGAEAAAARARQSRRPGKSRGGPKSTFGTAPKLRNINPQFLSNAHAATEHTGHDGPGPGGYYYSSSDEDDGPEYESKRGQQGQPQSARRATPSYRPSSGAKSARSGSKSARGKRPGSARSKSQNPTTTSDRGMSKLKRADAFLSHRVSGPRGGTFSRTSRDGAKRKFIGKHHVDLSVDRDRHLYPAPNQHNKLPGGLGIDRERTRALTGHSPRAVFGTGAKCVAEKDNKMYLNREQRRAKFGVEGPGPAAHSPRVGFLHELDGRARVLGFGGQRVGTAPSGRMRDGGRSSRSSRQAGKGNTRAGSRPGSGRERGDARAETTNRVKRRIGTFGTGPRLGADMAEREARSKPGPADYDDAIAMAVGDSLNRTYAMEKREAEDRSRRRDVLRASGRLEDRGTGGRTHGGRAGGEDLRDESSGGRQEDEEQWQVEQDRLEARQLAVSIARGSPPRGRRAPAYSFGTSTREHPYLTVLDSAAVEQPAPLGTRRAVTSQGVRGSGYTAGGESPRARILRESARNRERAGATSASVAAVTGSVGLMGGVGGPSGRPRFSARSSGRFGTTSLQRM